MSAAVPPRQLLLLRAALAEQPEAAAAYAEWCDGLDLDRLDLASQRLLPLLAERLEGARDDPVTERVQRIARFTWLKSQLLIDRTLPVLAGLEARGIPAMLVKGGALLVHTGGNPGRRPMDDLDILVPRARAATAVRALEELGFRSPHVDSRAGETPLFDEIHAVPFTDGHGAHVDLHWHLLQSSLHPSADDAFWAHATTGELRGAACLVGAPEDVLLHVIAHGWADDPAPSVRWMADAALLLQALPGLDWERFTAQARAHRLTDRVSDALRVLGDVPGVSVPPLHARAPRGLGRRGGELDAWARRAVPPGGTIGPLPAARWLRATWALPRTRSVPRHAAWIAARRPERLAARLGPAPVPPHPALVPVAFGEPVAFTDPLAPRAMLPAGWWCPDDHGAWSRGREAIVHIALDDPAGDALEIELGFVPFAPPGRPPPTVGVWAEGARRASWVMGRGGYVETRTVALPPRRGRSLAELRLVIDRPVSPLAARQSSDSRPLGIALRSLTVRAREADPVCDPSQASSPAAPAPVR